MADGKMGRLVCFLLFIFLLPQLLKKLFTLDLSEEWLLKYRPLHLSRQTFHPYASSGSCLGTHQVGLGALSGQVHVDGDR